MSGPVRRHSLAVYRRRRLVLLIGIVVVIGIVWLLIAQPWRGSAQTPAAQTPSATAVAPSPTDTPSASATDTPPPLVEPSGEATTPPAEAAPATAPACAAPAVTAEAITSQTTYGPDANPELSIRLTNTGQDACTINVGTSAQAFTVTSGSDVWWRSTDCQQEPSDMVVTLAAGQTVASSAPLVWDRTRSSVSTCDSTDRQRASGGGASYHLSVNVGGIASTQSAQFFLS